MIRLVYAPELVEEAVLLAEPGLARPDRRAFRRERDPLYEIVDQEGRDERFRALHMLWFLRLDLHRAIDQSVGDVPDLERQLDEARVLRALTGDDEGADLVDKVVPGRAGSAGTRPSLVIRLRPSLLLDADRVRVLLAHELMHVRDMLDPRFGYERVMPPPPAPLTEIALRDRYRVLWDATIDGRLARAGRVPEDVRAARRREFEATFHMIAGRGPKTFDAWFDRGQPTHAELMAFAQAPTLDLKEASYEDTGPARG